MMELHMLRCVCVSNESTTRLIKSQYTRYLQVAGEMDNRISNAIDRVLRQVFGEEAACLIYGYLENNYSLKRDEIAEKIDVFARGLEKFLSSGAYVVERKILEDIYSNCGLLRRLELEKPQEECDFVNQMKVIMRRA
jgi:hypothetical protein